MTIDHLWLFLSDVLREAIIGAVAFVVCIYLALVLLSALNRVGKS